MAEFEQIVVLFSVALSVCFFFMGHVINNQKLRNQPKLIFILVSSLFLFIVSLALLCKETFSSVQQSYKNWFTYYIFGWLLIVFALSIYLIALYWYNLKLYKQPKAAKIRRIISSFKNYMQPKVAPIRRIISSFKNYMQAKAAPIRRIISSFKKNIKVKTIPRPEYKDDSDLSNNKISTGIQFLDSSLGGRVHRGDVIVFEGEIGNSLEDVMTHILYAGLRQGYYSIYIAVSRPPDYVFKKYDEKINIFNSRINDFINSMIELEEHSDSTYYKKKDILFSWAEIPGSENLRLIDFLKHKYNIDWLKTTSNIEKIEDDNTIKVSSEKNYLLLRLNDEQTRVKVKIDECRIDDLFASTMNGKLNIYKKDNKRFWELIVDNLIYELKKFAYNHEALENFKKNLKLKITEEKPIDKTEIVGEIRNILVSNLFIWDDIPGNDSKRLIDFLKHKYNIDWLKTTSNIEKIDGGKTIKVSHNKNVISLILNDEKTKLKLKIDDSRIYELIASNMNGKLYIYGNIGSETDILPTFKKFIENDFLYVIDYNKPLIAEDKSKVINDYTELFTDWRRYHPIDNITDIENLHGCLKQIRKIIGDKKGSNPLWQVWDSSSTIFHLTVRDADSLHRTLDFFFHQASAAKAKEYVTFHSFKKGMHDDKHIKHLEHMADGVVSLSLKSGLTSTPFKFMCVTKMKNANIISVDTPYRINEGFVEKMWW